MKYKKKKWMRLQPLHLQDNTHNLRYGQKIKKNWRAVADKNFPKWGGPGGKTVGHKNVEVKDYMKEDITPLDVEEATTSSSSGQYSGPSIWAKGGKKRR